MDSTAVICSETDLLSSKNCTDSTIPILGMSSSINVENALERIGNCRSDHLADYDNYFKYLLELSDKALSMVANHQ